MKYSEFKREIEAMGLNTIIQSGCVEVWNEYGEMLFYIVMGGYDFSICTDYSNFDELDKEFKKKLFNLAVELASTPLDDREDEKRYRLRLPFVKDNPEYLMRLKKTGALIVSYPVPYYEDCQDEFTESEIAELKANHNLDSFVLEEVKEDE